MTTKRRWTDGERSELLKGMDQLLGQGESKKKAFKILGDKFNRTVNAVRFEYIQLTKKSVSAPAVDKKLSNMIHPVLTGITDYIKDLEEENEILKEQVKYLQEKNIELSARAEEADKIESDLNHLVSIIERSRKAAFVGDAAAKTYKLIDGVPVFEPV